MSSLTLDELFTIERETHLKTLAEGYQKIIENKQDSQLISAMFRAAHSLKGAARLVNNKEVESNAHSLEEVLKQLSETGVADENSKRCLREKLENLNGRLAIAEASMSNETVDAQSTQSILHLTSNQISEIIQISSELAVLNRRLDGMLQKGKPQQLSESDFDAILHDAQRSSALASQVQRLSYRLRLAPLAEITKGLSHLADSIASQLGKGVNLRILNSHTLLDRDLLRRIEPCLIQLLKNSIDHGLELPTVRQQNGKEPKGKITLNARQRGTVVEIEFSDDGAGINLDSLREKVVARGFHNSDFAKTLSSQELLEFLFLPGFSTRDEVSEISGRGIGLDIVKATLKELGGDVSIQSYAGQSTKFYLRIPSQIASFRSLLFRSDNTHIGVPLAFVERILDSESKTETFCSQNILNFEGQQIALVDVSRLLRLSTSAALPSAKRPIIILSAGGQRIALRVDQIEGEQEVVIQPLDARYRQEKRVLGITISSNNSIITVLNVENILAEASHEQSSASRQDDTEFTQNESTDTLKRKILIVDDSITVRELERRLLSQAGYSCEVAYDGLDGLEKAFGDSYDLIVSDIDMPRMNGFELIEKLRSDARFNNTPILVVSYKERIEDKEAATALGANHYLSKGSFKDDTFLNAISKLISEKKS